MTAGVILMGLTRYVRNSGKCSTWSTSSACPKDGLRDKTCEKETTYIMYSAVKALLRTSLDVRLKRGKKSV